MPIFDPYHRWLSIPPSEQPPNHYQLLGVQLFENDPDVIEAAADRQMGHLRTYQLGQHSDLSQKLLNEVAAAKVCLLNAEGRQAYDEQLREQIPPPPPTPAIRASMLVIPPPVPVISPPVLAIRVQSAVRRHGRRLPPPVTMKSWAMLGAGMAMAACLAWWQAAGVAPSTQAAQAAQETQETRRTQAVEQRGTPAVERLRKQWRLLKQRTAQPPPPSPSGPISRQTPSLPGACVGGVCTSLPSPAEKAAVKSKLYGPNHYFSDTKRRGTSKKPPGREPRKGFIMPWARTKESRERHSKHRHPK